MGEQTYKLSPSALNLMKDCPRCFWLTQHKVWKRPQGIFPSLPSGMDGILKTHFDKFMKQGKMPPELCEHDECQNLKLFDDEELLQVWRNNWKGISWEDKDGNNLHGAVDNILVKGKKLIVLDYKTRGYPLKEDTHRYYQNQVNLYTYLLNKKGYETEDYAYLLFYHPDKVIESVFHFHTDLIKMKASIKDAEKLWKDALKLLDGPMPLASKDCTYCPYRGIKVNSTLLDY